MTSASDQHPTWKAAPRYLRELADKRPSRPIWIALFGLLVVVALLSWAWMISGPLIDELTQVENSRLPRIAKLQAARNSDLRASLSLRNALVLKDPALQAQELERYREAAAAAEEALQDYRETLLRPEELAMLGGVLSAREIALAARRGAIEGIKQGTEPQALVPLLEAAIAPYLDALTYLQEDVDSRMKTMVDVLGLRSQSLRLLLTAAGTGAGLTMLLMGWAWRDQLAQEVRRREQRIADLQAQKQDLLREVHHRIKNHLQGLLALLDLHRQQPAPEEAGAVGTLHGHVLALIGLHGLQASYGDEGVPLRDLVHRQVALARIGFPNVEVTVAETAEGDLPTLQGDQAVSVALVVTELIVNAIKHGTPKGVRVTLGHAPDGAPNVVVGNATEAPMTLDIGHGAGLGTGLKLAQTLIVDVADLVQRSEGSELEMELRLLSSEVV